MPCNSRERGEGGAGRGSERGKEREREGGGKLTPTFLRRSPTILRAEIRVEGV